MDTLIPTKDLLKQLQDAGVAYEENKDGARERLMSLCYTLIASLESPGESLQRMGWAEPARNADCRVAVDLKLFELMREDEEIGVQGVTVKELAGKAGADEVLICEMTTIASYDMAWLTIRLVERFDPSKGDGVLLVAMGNARGNDGFLRKVRELFRGHRGRLILQATEEVFIQVLLSGYVGIFQTMPHDISDPQPVQKARAYYLRTALRGKSEQVCVNILEQLKPAIEPGYSVVLLNEVIVSSQHAPWRVTSVDRVTGVTFAKKERTEEEMARIIEKAGFKIRKTHRYPMACSILIEIILDSEPLIEDGSEDDGAMETAIDPDPGIDADVDMEDCIVVATD
ncbi:hypothetical protein J7T55_010437 [Diaporthe amygdali]|uniref:uncharacterized protein n=1 Tax=Phomopsis amygdali TaxID=1214568 RepID=UPI0022FE7668|nr:uncharacterized protein J7T55_010437 [Diaporthe amygdali]KAJ0115614.1 hypothetical protein J7T55_010437 [Diaporthe amygdali]